MAVKKCDEIVDEAVVESSGTDPCEPGFHLENGVCVPDIVTQQRPSQVTAPTSLGKTLKIVESPLFYDPDSTFPSAIATFGDKRINTSRPAGILDPLRAEARKFFVLNNDGTMVYLNSNLTEDYNSSWWTNQAPHLPSSDISANDASSPITITFTSNPQEIPATSYPPTGPWGNNVLGHPAMITSRVLSPEEFATFLGDVSWAADMFKVYRQNFEISSNQFINNPNSSTPVQDMELCSAWLAFIDDPWTPGAAPQTSLIQRDTPLVEYQKAYTDHYTTMNAPFSQRELERFVNNLNTPSYVNIIPDYNFYEQGYEELLSMNLGTGLDDAEWMLPNLYSVISKENNPLQENLASYGIGGTYLRSVSQIPPVYQPTWLAEVVHFKNIAFPSSQVTLLPRGSDHDDVYPMNINLEFLTEQTGDFGIAAGLAGMTDNLSQFVMNETLTLGTMPQSAMMPFALSNETLVRTIEMNSSGPTPKFHKKVQLEQKEIQLMDLEKWLWLYLDGDPSTTYQMFPAFNDITIFLGTPTNQAQDECTAFRDTLQAIILSGKINQLVENHFRTFEEMLQGKKAYNETLIYEIVKKSSAMVSTPMAIQRIFIPNTAELNILNYIDTQVKYDKEYTYEIFAHQLIVGTQYHYIPATDTISSASGFTQGGAGPGAACAGNAHPYRVEYTPSLKIARIPIYTQKTRILDTAPVWPNVDLVPYKGVSDQFLINLSSNVGDYHLHPIVINERDAKFVQKFRNSRQLSPDEPINFKSDDPVQHFEIYRMDTPPSSYKDFAGHLLAVEVSKKATAISYIDNILPNQKYYYMFRGVDVHGNRSNPTEVYQVEIMEFDGMMFFYTSIYNFEDPLDSNNNVSSSRSLKRYLKINPNFIQSLINYEDTFANASSPDATAYDAGAMHLGQAEHSVWSSATDPKRFKIRVTSKNSGKKFDLNLTCKVLFNKGTQPT